MSGQADRAIKNALAVNVQPSQGLPAAKAGRPFVLRKLAERSTESAPKVAFGGQEDQENGQIDLKLARNSIVEEPE